MEAGLVDELQLNAALAEQRKWGGKLGRTLVEMKFIDEETMMLALSRQLNLPLIDLDHASLPPTVVQHLRVDVAERYGVFPVAADVANKTISLATSDPTNMEAAQELAFHTGLRVQQLVASASAIDRAIRRFYYGETTVASPTATPQGFGVSETVFDPEALAAPPKASPEAATELSGRLAQLSDQLAHVEKIVVGQVRAMRGMLELLVEKGVLTREEYLARVRGRDQ